MNEDINIRSLRYLLAQTEAACPHCGTLTPLFGLAVPPGHMVLELDAETDDEDAAVDSWHIASDAAFLFYVAYLPDLVHRRLQRLAPSFRLGNDAATGADYWANHCRQCGLMLADHDLFCEPGGAFLPTTELSAGLIQLLPIDEAFEAAAAGYAHQPEFFDAMR